MRLTRPGRVGQLIVGKNYVRLVNLSDGKEAGRVDKTGMPTGRGALASSRYYLPAHVGADKEPSISVIDLGKAQLLSHIKSAKNEPIGNLIFFGDQAAAQSVDGIRVYPQAKERE